MDFSPECLARQMTLLDNELFQKLDVRFKRSINFIVVKFR